MKPWTPILWLLIAAACCMVAFLIGPPPTPTPAAECVSFDVELQGLIDRGVPVFIFKWAGIGLMTREVEKRTGRDFPGVTRAFAVPLPTELMVGLEADGCLLPPVHIVDPSTLPGA